MGGRPLSIEGVDVEDALERIEDLELLEELLGEFATTWADGAGRIERPLADGHREKAGDVAHALAGVAGTLSIVEVRTSARRLEDLLRGAGGAEEIAEEIAHLTKALAAIVVAIEEARAR